MKQLFNYSTVPGYEEAIRRTGKSLEEYLAMLGLDGIELLVYRSEPYMRPFDKVAVGAHLRSWSCWYDLWKTTRTVSTKSSGATMRCGITTAAHRNGPGFCRSGAIFRRP